MASVASSRTVSATVFLALMVIGWCLASAVPVAANARRLQQIPVSGAGGGLTDQLQALTAGLQKLSDQVKLLLGTVALPADLQGQLQQVALSFATAQAQVQTEVRDLLLLVPHPETLPVLQDLLKQLATKLETVSTQFQNAQPVGGCFSELQAGLMDVLSALEDKLTLTLVGLPTNLAALIAALRNLGHAVSQVDACAPGLQSLPSNGRGVILALGELVAGIQGS
ncbi:hypothetical protein GQ55_9G162700 [Panicum hallii var. hallii]|jgi:hypothetical protein|uniref:DOG1 domain-containing protein n=1 Tax=Panicum hallii var. hallii TaxID=1504633 RepID=A0A2T7C3U3_9POAL|nr:hypothetical protein GQ55_9G162700 [Panicum hallii var. hallii]